MGTPQGPAPTGTAAVTAVAAGSIPASLPVPPTAIQTMPRPPASARGAARAADFAPTLGASRGLIVGAYAELGAEGYLVLRRGAPPGVAAVARPAPLPAAARDPRPRFNLRPDLPDLTGFAREEWLRSYRAALKRAPDQ